MKLHHPANLFGIFMCVAKITLFLISCNQSESEGISSEESLGIAGNAGDKSSLKELSFLQDTNYRMADSLLNLKEGEKAIPYLEKALERFQNDSNYRGIVSIINKLGLSYITMREFSKGLLYSKQAAEIARKHYGENDTLSADAFYQIGLCYDQEYKADSALDYHQKALRIQQIIYGNMHKKVADSYLAIGNVYNWVLYDVYNASDNYYAALRILEKLPSLNKEKLIRCYYNLAVICQEIGELDKALTYENEILNVLDNQIHNKMIFKEITYTLIANTYFYKNDFNTSIEYYKKAIHLNQTNYT
ncbi:MAG: tetratricopeptide repeat protein, partial [Bacteroidales bacterium]|nr:tetratricopeptide repeat protein [Bacteroidales bacterium]